MALILDLPWPDRRLHPNARVHHMVKARAAKMARLSTAWLARTSGLHRIQASALSVKIVFSPPDSRGRDLDGMLSNIKSHLDGVADVIGIDDRHWRLSLERSEPVKGGNVRIIIKEIVA